MLYSKQAYVRKTIAKPENRKANPPWTTPKQISIQAFVSLSAFKSKFLFYVHATDSSSSVLIGVSMQNIRFRLWPNQPTRYPILDKATFTLRASNKLLSTLTMACFAGGHLLYTGCWRIIKRDAATRPRYFWSANKRFKFQDVCFYIVDTPWVSGF